MLHNRTTSTVGMALLLGMLGTTSLYGAQTVAEADLAFDVDNAPPEARGKILPNADPAAGGGKYTDAAGLYTFLMPPGWTMTALDDEAQGIAFRGSSGKNKVNCVLSAKNYLRGARTLSELQATPDDSVRTTFEQALIDDTGWKKVEKRGTLALGDGGRSKRTPVKVWTWGSLSPDGKAYDTVAIVEAPAATLLVLCGSAPDARDVAEPVIKRSFRLATGALIAPAARPSAPGTPARKAEEKTEDRPIFQEAMRAYQRGDYATALQLLLPLAEQGNPLAQNNLGVMYDKGYGVAQDEAAAAKWYRKAAGLGNTKAQFSLGVMLANGRGVAKDDVEAGQWYRKAAEQGHAEAQYNTGLRYAGGRGVETNATEAANWYRKSAEQGYAKAQTNLGVLYSKGEGVTKDDAEAVKWYRMAAEQGNALGQFNLGLKLLNGQGAARNPVAATMWISLAAQGDEKKAVARLEALGKQLTPEQAEQAKKLADECKARDYRDCL